MTAKKRLSDLSITYISQAFIVLSNVIIIRLLTYFLSVEEFGVFLISKRIANIGYIIITMNLGISLARFVSFNIKQAKFLLLISHVVMGGLFFIITMLSFISPINTAGMLWGSAELSLMILPTLALLYITALKTIVTGYFRGANQFSLMNKIIIISNFAFFIAFIPALISPGEQFNLSIYFYSYTLIVIIIMTYYQIRYELFSYGSIKGIVKFFKEQGEYINKFLKYGISRFPAAIFYSTLFFLPPIIATNRYSLEYAAYIGIFISISTLVTFVGNPFGLIALPKFSQQQANNEIDVIKKRSQNALDFSLNIPFILALVFFLFSYEILWVWFGKDYVHLVEYMIVFTPSIAFIILYTILRGIIDGIDNYPYINIITFSSFLVFLLGILYIQLFKLQFIYLVGIYSLSLVILGMVTITVIKHRLQLIVFHKKNSLSLVIISALFIIEILFLPIINQLQFYYAIMIKSIFLFLSFMFFLWYYKRMDYSWNNNLRRVILNR